MKGYIIPECISIGTLMDVCEEEHIGLIIEDGMITAAVEE